MSFNFPTGATNGQEYTSGSTTFVYNGYGWVIKAAISEAPIDSKLYGRKNAAWAEVIQAVLEAPVDSKYYARRNSAWAEIIADVTKSYVDTQDTSIRTDTTAALGLKYDKTGGTVNGSITMAGGDLRAYRAGGTTGVLYLSSADHYLYWNGTNFQLNGGPLSVSSWSVTSQSYIRGNGDMLRWRGNTFSVITHHNDGAFYLMVTNAGDPDGGWNGQRPFQIANSGDVTMSHTVSTGALNTGNISAGRILSNATVHAGYNWRHGTFAFGDANTDRYVTYDGANVSWSVAGGTHYLNGPLNSYGITCHAINTQGNGITAAGINASNVATDGATMMGKSYAYIGWDNGGKGAIEVRSGDAGWDSFISFHQPGAFATYFGLRNSDKNMCFGGWSHGNNSWKLWSERDFGFPRARVYDVRMEYVGGDYGNPNDGVMREPHGGAAATGFACFSDGGMNVRYRRIQIEMDGNWYTINYT
jgi:hypothetical protein